MEGTFSAIDIGSNSIRLLVAQFTNGLFLPLYKSSVHTRLSQGVSQSKTLLPAAMERTIKAMLALRQAAVAHGSQKTVCFATSAVREAQNRQEFLDLAAQNGFLVEIISGELEAQIGFLGATEGIGEPCVGTIDIGGGSTEIIAGVEGLPYFSQSYQVGTVRCYDRFAYGDPPDRVALSRMGAWIRKQFSTTRAQINSVAGMPHKWLGLGGTVSTFAAIDLQMTHCNQQQIHGHTLTATAVNSMRRKLSAMNMERRKNVPGVPVFNADIILASGAILSCIMRELMIDELTVSGHDNLEGYLLKTMKETPQVFV